MALQIKYDKNIYGKTIPFEQAYLKVMEYGGNKETTNISVTIFDNLNKQYGIDTLMYSFSQDISNEAPNIVKQAYEYLKTLPEYAEAIDC